jgi:hypothetical protein
VAQSEKDYLCMDKKTRIDLALSLDIRRSTGSAHFEKILWGLRDEKNPRQALHEQFATTQFELNEDFNPFFRKFINQKLIDGERIANHIADLAFIMLWDVLSETQPTIRDLTEKGKYPHSYTIDKREARRLINEYYDYMHYHPYKWDTEWEKIADDPKNLVISFKGPRLKRPLPDPIKKSLQPVSTPLTERKPFNTEIRLEDYADPYYLKRLFSFRTKLLWMLETIERKTIIRKEYRWVKDQLIYCDFALTVFFKNAAMEAERRWFDYNLSVATKSEIIWQHLAGFYTESEIKNTIDIYKKLLGDLDKQEYQRFKPLKNKVAENFFEQITLAAVFFANKGETNISWWLFSNLLNNGFKIEGKNRACLEHNLGIFEFIFGEPQSACTHFKSALEYWRSTNNQLLEEIDKWNYALALDRVNKGTKSNEEKVSLVNTLAKKQSSAEVRFFLILQFADISQLFGAIFPLQLWLERGLQESAVIPDFADLALFFESRLGSPFILGSTEKDRKKTLGNVASMKDKYCKIFENAKNFIVVIDNQFYLLNEEIAKRELAKE